MTSIYDVQQLRAPSQEQRSASEAAAAAEARRYDTLSLNESPFGDAYDWVNSHIPPTLSYNSMPSSYPGYNNLDVMFGARSNTGLEGLFNSTFYPTQYPRAYSGAMQKSVGIAPYNESSSPATSYASSTVKSNSQSSTTSAPTAGSQPYVRPSQPGGVAGVPPYLDNDKALKRSLSYSSTASNDPMNVLAKSPEIVKFLEENYERADESCSIPRCDLYNHYQQYCGETGQMITCQASFGKVIRQLFPWLKARRLGTRGKSKYHYCGIRQIRPTVPIHKLYAAQQSMSLPAGSMALKSASYDVPPSDTHSMYGADTKASDGPPLSRSVDTFASYTSAPSSAAVRRTCSPAAVRHSCSQGKHDRDGPADGESLSVLYQRNPHPARHYSMPASNTADPSTLDMNDFSSYAGFYHPTAPANDTPAAPNDDLSLVNDFLQ